MSDELPSFPELNELEDHDILIIVVEKLRTIEDNQKNFYKHFWAVALLFIGTGLTGVISLIVALPSIISSLAAN